MTIKKMIKTKVNGSEEELPMPKLTSVKALENYKIWVAYSDNTEGEVDLSHLTGHSFAIFFAETQSGFGNQD